MQPRHFVYLAIGYLAYCGVTDKAEAAARLDADVIVWQCDNRVHEPLAAFDRLPDGSLVPHQ